MCRQITKNTKYLHLKISWILKYLLRRIHCFAFPLRKWEYTSIFSLIRPVYDRGYTLLSIHSDVLYSSPMQRWRNVSRPWLELREKQVPTSGGLKNVLLTMVLSCLSEVCINFSPYVDESHISLPCFSCVSLMIVFVSSCFYYCDKIPKTKAAQEKKGLFGFIVTEMVLLRAW